MSRSRPTPVLAVLLTLLLAVGLLGTAPAALAAPAAPPTPSGLPAAIEPLGEYVEQIACDPTVRPGTRRLATLLAHTYAATGATYWASTYACGTDGFRSEHYDGRAIDWNVSARNRAQLAAAKSALAWLMATDKRGNAFAMARRLGVMYVIFNNRMWGAWDGRWEEYNNCSHLPSAANDNACHRTHMHISLTWNGAMGRTSYWTKRVPATDFGRCRAGDLNWAPRYHHANRTRCPSFPMVTAKAGSSATKRALVTYSGAAVRRGWQGPAVSAVQSALHVAATGSFDAATASAVRRFQSRHACPVTGAKNQTTWRALLRAVR